MFRSCKRRIATSRALSLPLVKEVLFKFHCEVWNSWYPLAEREVSIWIIFTGAKTSRTHRALAHQGRPLPSEKEAELCSHATIVKGKQVSFTKGLILYIQNNLQWDRGITKQCRANGGKIEIYLCAQPVFMLPSFFSFLFFSFFMLYLWANILA